MNTFSSLRTSTNYRLYFSGQVVSLTGTWMQNTAMAWLVGVILSHSAEAIGVLVACQFGPYAVLGLAGGVISDRFDRRRVYMVTQALSMVLAGVMTILTIARVITIGEVYVLAALLGTVTVFDNPARQSLTMELVGRHEVPNAVALNSTMFNLSRVAGPAIGGLLIATVGVSVCFAINTVSFLAVLLGLLLMNTKTLHQPNRPRERPSVLRGTLDGLRFAWRTPEIRIVLIMMTVIATLAMNLNVIMPVMAARTLHAGPQTFGIVSASFGLGALVGALVSATLASTDLRIIVGAAAVSGAAQFALAPSASLLWCCVLLFVTGTGFSLYSSNANAAVQMNTPDHLRGRVLGLYAYVFFGTAPIGGFLAGWLCERGGTEMAFLVAGVAMLVASAIGFVRVAGDSGVSVARLSRLRHRRMAAGGAEAGHRISRCGPDHPAGTRHEVRIPHERVAASSHESLTPGRKPRFREIDVGDWTMRARYPDRGLFRR